MSKTAEKTNVCRLLDAKKVPYTEHTYPPEEALSGVEVAEYLHQDPARVFKTLVTKGHSGGYFVFVVPVEKELDLKKCARSVGEKSVEMIHVRDITKVTGYVRGGCSPLCMKKPYPTVFHESAGSIDRIIVSAGKIGYQIDLAPGDLLRLSNGTLADIIKQESI